MATGMDPRRSAPRAGRRWGIGLVALALALSPLAVLVLRPVTPGPEPAITPGPLAQPPAGEAPAALPSPEAAVLSEAAPSRDPSASAPMPPPIACRRDAPAPGEYSRCLYDTIRASEQALEAEVANAMGFIAGRSDLAPVQRARWTSLFEEAQSRFVLYRNFDCQSVAPFEGRRGIGNFEARALCLIASNTRRADELAARYARPAKPPGGAAAPAGPDGPDGPLDRPGAWTHPTPPPLE